MTNTLPQWSVADVHESLTARTFLDSMEQLDADVSRLQALFDHHGVRATEPRQPTPDDAAAADAVLRAHNAVSDLLDDLAAYVYSTVSTDSRHEAAQALMSQIDVLEGRTKPLTARLAEWVTALGVDELCALSAEAQAHVGPLTRLSARAEHQMSEAEESLHAELAPSGPGAWNRLQSDVTSQLTADVAMPDGTVSTLPMPVVRGLAAHHDAAVRRAAYEAELSAWPRVAVPCAAAMNGVKGAANVVNRRRQWASPLDASLFANSVSRATFDAMQSAVADVLDDFRAWMRAKAALHGTDGPLKWWDLMAPLPFAPENIKWDDAMEMIIDAFDEFSPQLSAMVHRALREAWIDAAPRDGKVGGAFCMPFVGDRSLVLLNWAGSVDSAQTTAHELGHAYHNTQLAHRTPLQRHLPMALAETASIFCETLVVEAGLRRYSGDDRLALLDVDLQGSLQVVVDIHSRFLFETEVFARRRTRTLGVSELNEMMLDAQQRSYGDGLDPSTRHPYMWILKSHYYASHYYNWPYTYGLLFGLGLYAQYELDPEHFRSRYDNLLSTTGMATAEELGREFGLDVTDEAFWRASCDVLRARMTDYMGLANSRRDSSAG